VNNGAVTARGDVASAAERIRISELVRAAPGVKDMVTVLEIKPKK
jgi:osmotically-inducible protein OsmY